MPSGEPYARAVVTPQSPRLREEIVDARRSLGIPPEGLPDRVTARQWYTDHGGKDPTVVGNSPPGPVPNLRPSAQALADLVVVKPEDETPLDREARRLTLRWGLPASLVGWVREELLRDTSSDATSPTGRLGVQEFFRQSEREIPSRIKALQAQGQALAGVYCHVSPLHVGIQSSSAPPHEYAVVITGIDAATTSKDWKAITAYAWAVLGQLLDRPRGRRPTPSEITRDLRLWQLYESTGSAEAAADAWQGANPSKDAQVDAKAVRRAVRKIRRRFNAVKQVAEVDEALDAPARRPILALGRVSGPRSYQEGGFQIMMPELTHIDDARVSMGNAEPSTRGQQKPR